MPTTSNLRSGENPTEPTDLPGSTIILTFPFLPRPEALRHWLVGRPILAQVDGVMGADVEDWEPVGR